MYLLIAVVALLPSLYTVVTAQQSPFAAEYDFIIVGGKVLLLTLHYVAASKLTFLQVELQALSWPVGCQRPTRLSWFWRQDLHLTIMAHIRPL